MKTSRKGFTIVELVVIIIVIAVLSAVLIPAFKNAVKNAQNSSDNAILNILNSYVEMDLVGKKKLKHDTMYDAIQACANNGYSSDKFLTDVDKTIAWNSETGRFVFLDIEKARVTYQDLSKSDEYIELTVADEDKSKYFVMTQYSTCVSDERFLWSVYAYGKKWPKNLVVKSGFDAGEVEGFETITYLNRERIKNVIIRTNSISTKLVIDGYVVQNAATGIYIGDAVTHYGFAGIIEVIKVAMNSFYEFGTVGRLTATAEDAYGHIVIKNSAKVYEIEQNANAGTCISVEPNATIYNAEHMVSKERIVRSTTRFAVGSEEIVCVDECSHQYTDDVKDLNNTYEICKVCGYTVINNYDENTNTLRKDVVFEDGENVICERQTICKEVNYSTPPVCEHIWDNGVILDEPSCIDNGNMKYTCQICSKVEINSIEALGHNGTLAENRVAPTCTVAGCKAYYYCTRCENYFADKSCETLINNINEWKNTDGAIEKTNHAGSLTHADAVEATTTTTGNIEYWYCTVCKKYFSNSTATTEITQNDTIISKIAETVSKKWVFNDYITLVPSELSNKEYTTNFVINGTKYNLLSIGNSGPQYYLYGNNVKTSSDDYFYEADVWWNSAFKTVVFDEAPSGDLLTLLNEIATPVETVKSTWLINSDIETSPYTGRCYQYEFEVSYTSNGQTFYYLRFGKELGYELVGRQVGHENLGVTPFYYDYDWANEAYRTLVFDEQPTGDLLVLLQTIGTEVVK